MIEIQKIKLMSTNVCSSHRALVVKSSNENVLYATLKDVAVSICEDTNITSFIIVDEDNNYYKHLSFYFGNYLEVDDIITLETKRIYKDSLCSRESQTEYLQQLEARLKLHDSELIARVKGTNFA